MRSQRSALQGVFRMRNVAIKLLLVNVVVFFLQGLLGRGFTTSLALVGADVLSRPWILFTSMFLHGSFTHLLFNMYALFLFGTLIERRIGSRRFLWAYLISGVVASAIFTLANPSGMAVGASGAIMAVLGLVIMLMPDLKVLFFFVIPMSMRTAGVIFALIDLVGFVSGGTGIAHAAHLGGLACGLAYGYYLKRKGRSFKKGFQDQGRRFREPKRRSPYYDDERTIELSQDDIDQYYKYGRL
ncbi:MAG: rhomboid family intramembrane serine protease [Candidatus Woesearchaeota archaeon]